MTSVHTYHDDMKREGHVLQTHSSVYEKLIVEPLSPIFGQGSLSW